MYFSISQQASNKKEIIRNSYISNFAIILLFTAIMHHFVLCFLNTTLLHVSYSWLVLTELFLLTGTAIFFIRDANLNYLLLILFIIANAFALAVFQGIFDPKNIRNFVMPILLVWLGSKYDNKVPVDKLVFVAGVVVILIGLFELFFPDVYQKFFNVLNFQISTGRLNEAHTKYAETSFALNGTRYGGRNMLSFLGDHRVSSVFLETVTVSNFATVLVAWGLAKSDFKELLRFVLLGFTIAVLADSRFGVTLISLMVFLRFSFNKTILKIISYLSPIFIILICFYLGKDFTVFRDDFPTRLGSTGYHLLNFKPLEFFGLYGQHTYRFMDQGYAKLLHYNGLVLATGLWVVLVRLRLIQSSEKYKIFICIIIAANLAISGDSVFAFKWAALMWFLLGTQLIKNESRVT